MAYDEELADRIRSRIGGQPGLSEKRMFGGLAFLVDGNMVVSASSRGGLLLRCDPARTDELIQPPHTGRFVMRGREMDGWLRIDPAAVSTDTALAHWIDIALTYASSLPAK